MSEKTIHANIIAATRPENGLGLATFYVRVPYYIWVEILTHKRLSRNASSARAQKPYRHMGEGFYMPPVFYENKKGMTVGKPLEPTVQVEAQQIYKEVWDYCTQAVKRLEDLSVSKEQANRVVPAFKMVSAIVTATEDAWKNFLQLRYNSQADVAMQAFAAVIFKELKDQDSWTTGDIHAPYYVHGDSIYSLIGKIARVTYNLDKEFSIDENEKLGKRLIKNGHMSPLEHVARWQTDPYPSAIFSKEEDIAFSEDYEEMYGWQSLRADYEDNGGILDKYFLGDLYNN